MLVERLKEISRRKEGMLVAGRFTCNFEVVLDATVCGSSTAKN
jgi:hypothetical protein